MAEYAEPVGFHDLRHARGVHPCGDVAPRRFVLQITGHEMVRDSGAVEDAGDFRRGTGLTMGEPFPSHRAAILHGVDFGVINRRRGLKVQRDDRRANRLRDRQHG